METICKNKEMENEKENNNSEREGYFVYLLECCDKSTYIGATINLNHRLRQHNGEIKGGAHVTTSKVSSGNYWERVCHVKGFPTWQIALQFEWAWKFHSRKLPKKMYPLKRRLLGLQSLLSLEKSTSKSIPYSEYHPTIVWESSEAEQMYRNITCQN